MTVKALRGAVQLNDDTPQQITAAVKQLLETIMDKNSLREDQIISVFFSQTKDLRSCNPASAARKAGFESFCYFCLQELDVDNSFEKMIRVLMHVSCSSDAVLHPVYLGGAEKLRPDLFTSNFPLG